VSTAADAAARFVVVALVVVLYATERPPANVDDADITTPTVVVGESAPAEISNDLPKRLAEVR
jgi:hypothetical protein